MEKPRLPIRFGVFEVDPASGELRKHGVRIRLPEQPLQALLALIERPGEVVTRDELQNRLWSAGTTVDFDRGINKAINRLREALSADADTPRYIETLPQRGYRFLMKVDSAAPGAPVAPPTPELQPTPLEPVPRIHRRTLLAFAGGLSAVPLIYLGYRHWPSSSQSIDSIAVLPLENLSRNPAQEYFSNGVTDQLITEISRISSLRVISRTSVMRYKGGGGKSLPEIARDLGVDAILEGTVMQVGPKVRITAQLIRARDDRHLWSEKYERDLSDVLRLQADVAEDIARQVRAKLAPQAKGALARRVHPQAYEAYLKGNLFFDRPTVAGLAKSIGFFTEAIQIDPAYAQAHAGLAQAYNFVGIFGFHTPGEALAKAKSAAMRALELDDTLAEAHNALAETKKNYDWDWIGAETEYRRALALKASYFLAYTWYAECLSRMGRHDDAVAMAKRARELDPISMISNTALGMLLYRARRYEEAIAACQKALELGRHPNALWFQSLAYEQTLRFREAVAGLKEAVSLSKVPVFRAALGYAYARAGNRAGAVAMLNDLKRLAQTTYVSPRDIAMIYTGLRDPNSAFTGWNARIRSATSGFRCYLRNSTSCAPIPDTRISRGESTREVFGNRGNSRKRPFVPSESE